MDVIAKAKNKMMQNAQKYQKIFINYVKGSD